MNRRSQIFRYIFFDYIAALGAWVLFFIYRKYYIEETALVTTRQFYLGAGLIPLCWILLYTLTGFYNRVFRKSRLREFFQTLNTSFFGVLMLFFALLLDDEVMSYKDYYYTFGTLFGLHFVLTYLFRLAITSRTVRKIRRRQFGFNTLLVGGDRKSAQLYKELTEARKQEGYLVKGYVTVGADQGDIMPADLSYLGNRDDLKRVIIQQEIEEVIIAIESTEHHLLNDIINTVDNGKVIIKILPDMYDIIAGSVKMSHIFGAVLIELDTQLMPDWQKAVKRAIDIVLSAMALIVGLPLYIAIALAIKLSSKGPVFFFQERIGFQGKPFKIIKFRTMVTDAEASGPQLSSKEDPRITKVGRFLRKTRLDEIPQFYNVLIGDMSVVGPRPERQFFIDQITLHAPHYVHLHRVRPGITSWGQVKYGYAESVDQMVERLKFDLLYIENMTLALDLKILIYTVLIMVQGRGK